MQAKDPAEKSQLKPSKETCTETLMNLSPTELDRTEPDPTAAQDRPPTMMEQIAWQITKALYRAQKLCVTPPTEKQRKLKTWNEGQHRQYLIEIAEFLTMLLVEVSTQAAAKAKEITDVRCNNAVDAERPNTTRTESIPSNRTSEHDGEITGRREETKKSGIIVPEGFGR